MKPFLIQSGLFIDSTNTICGYVFNVLGHGAYHPAGLIRVLENGKEREVTQEEVDTHNKALATAELAAIEKCGKGVLYLTTKDGKYSVGTWTGDRKGLCDTVRTSDHNMAGRNGRTDVYFTLGGKRWHGVNIGNNQICRIHVLKRQ